MHPHTYADLLRASICVCLPLIAACAGGPSVLITPTGSGPAGTTRIARSPRPEPPRHLPHYALKAQIDPGQRRVQAETTTWLRHDPKQPLRFFLHRALHVQAVLLNGNEAMVSTSAATLPYVKDVQAHRVETSGSKPREVTVVQVRYAGVLPASMDQVNGISPDLVELAAYAGWYPVFDKATGLLTSELAVSLPSGLKVVSRGRRLSGGQTGDGTRSERWRAEVPGHDITLLASPRFQSLSRGGVHLFHTKLARPFGRKLLDLSSRALKSLRAAFGPERTAPGDRALRLVLSPRSGWGYSRPGLIVLSEEQVKKGATEPALLRETLHKAAHEMGHLWWLLADTRTQHDWINEAFAEYSALRASDALFGPMETAAWRGRYLDHLERKRPPVAIVDTAISSPHRYVNWYERGALMLDALEHLIGREALDRFLRRLHTADRQHPLTTADLQRGVTSSLGRDARSLVDRWLRARRPTPAWLARQRRLSAARARRQDELSFITDKLERVYSYLEVKQKRHGVRYPALKREIADQVRRARSATGYIAAIKKLLGRFHDGHLKLVLAGSRPSPAPARAAAISRRWLPKRILLLRIARLTGDARRIRRELQRSVSLLPKARGLIVDLRGNPGGNAGLAFDHLVARLFAKPILLGKSSVRLSSEVLAQRPHYKEIYPPDPSRPGFSGWREALIEPKTSAGYAGPIAVLVDKGCYSSCESVALAFRESGGARLFGQPTGGGSANPIALDLPHTRGKLLVPTWVFVMPSGELLEDNGVKPHVTISAKEDALKRAVRAINARRGHTTASRRSRRP